MFNISKKMMFVAVVFVLITIYGVSMVFSEDVARKSAIFEVSTAEELQKIVADLPKKGTIVFLDVDDTLITPVSKTFRAPPSNKMMDEIKKNKHIYPNFDEIISNWRLQREAMLIDAKWPDILEGLKEQLPVYGLTKMNTGKLGNIPSMEVWRYDELSKLGVMFSQTLSIPNRVDSNHQENPVFYKGIFMTGEATKEEVLDLYWQYLNPSIVVFADDRMSHVKEIKELCERKNTRYIGIHFSGIKKLPGDPNAVIAELQKKHLLKHAEWLEDSMVEAYLEKSQ